jgi:hypothetical protein
MLSTRLCCCPAAWAARRSIRRSWPNLIWPACGSSPSRCPDMAAPLSPDDISVENYARLIAEAAADLGCDVVVGFSMGANYALEMAGAGAFHGPLILLAPSSEHLYEIYRKERGEEARR